MRHKDSIVWFRVSAIPSQKGNLVGEVIADNPYQEVSCLSNRQTLPVQLPYPPSHRKEVLRALFIYRDWGRNSVQSVAFCARKRQNDAI